MARLRLEEIVPVRYSEQIASRLEALMVSHDLRPGDKLPPERELATSFGVSRPAVREALKLLAERGLVQSRMGNGTFVVDPGLSGVVSSIGVASRMRHSTPLHVDEVRAHLEIGIAGLAAERATPADLEVMERAIRAMDLHLDDADGFIKADLEFHAALAAATQNPLFLILSYSIIDLVSEERFKLFPFGDIDRSQFFHKSILQHVKNRDSAGARQMMQEHLEYTAGLQRQLEASGGELPPR